MASNLKVQIDWNRDGTFTGPFDDVTVPVRGGSAGQVTVEQGRDLSSVLPQMLNLNGDLTLDNRTRRYSRRNTSSPLSGLVLPARPFQLQRVVGGAGGVGGTTQSLARGRTNDQEAEPDPERQTVTFGIVDVLRDLGGRKVTTAVGLKQGIRAGDALNALLDDVGWTAGRDIDPGVSLLPVWFEEGNDVLDSIGRLLFSEGPPAAVYVDPTGTFVFRDRHHRILDAVSATAQSTWRASGKVEPVLASGFRARDSWSTIINDVSVQVPVWQVMGEEILWTSDEGYFVPPSLSGDLTITGEASDPFINPRFEFVQGAGSPVNVQSIAPGLGPDFTVTFHDGAIGNSISNVRLWAQPIRQVGVVTVTASDATSQTAYGVRSLPGSDSIGPWCSTYDAQAIAAQIVLDRKDPLTQLTARFVVGRTAAGTRSASDQRANAVLARQLSHRVNVQVPREGIAEDYFVEGIRHVVAGEEDHEVWVTAEQAPTASPSGTTVFRFDTAGQGFDQGVFGR